MTMSKQILMWAAFLFCFASCNNNSTRSSEQNELSGGTETVEEIPGYSGNSYDEGVAPTDGVPDEEIPDGQYAYEDDNYSDNYSEETSIYDHNGDGEPVRNDNFYYQEGYSKGRSSGDFDRRMIYEDDCEFIKGSYRNECDLGNFLDSDRTNKEHYLIYKQGFLDGWNSIEGALD